MERLRAVLDFGKGKLDGRIGVGPVARRRFSPPRHNLWRGLTVIDFGPSSKLA